MTGILRTQFDNGLILLAEATHDAPVVALQAWVNVGSGDEDESMAGVAHLHEHMLFKGTERRGVGEIARTVEASGGEINAWTSFDQTVYHVIMAAEECDTGLDILSDAIRHSSFDATELTREIEVVLEEIRRAEDAPGRRASNALFSLAYETHPYRRPVLGSERSVSGMSRDQILSFYREHYRPDNTILVAVGDFEPQKLIESVKRHFGTWKAEGSYTRRTRAVEEPQETARLRILREPVKEARINVAWHIPGLCHADTPALDVLALVLGQGDSSRLYLETRRRRELVNDIGAYAYTPRDPGLFTVGAGLRGENLTAALRSLLEVTFRLRHHHIDDEELDKAKVTILSDTAYQRETVQGQARKLGFYEVVAGTHTYEAEYLQGLRAVTVEDVRSVAERYLHARPTLVAQVDTHAEVTEAELGAILSEVSERSWGKGSKRGSSKDVQRIQLQNGAIILVRQEDSPVVAMRAGAYGGLRWETETSNGLSSLFGALWGMATADSPTDIFSKRVAALGGSLGAFAGRNTVGMRGEFTRDKGVEGLRLFCEALLKPAFAPEDLERERAVTLERIKNRDDNPGGVAFELFAETLYPTHPYGMRMSGTETTVNDFGIEDVMAFRAQFVTPDKLVVAVVGGIDAERVVDFLTEQLETESAISLGDPMAMDAPPTGLQRAQYHLDKKQSHVLVGSMGTTIYNTDRFALEVLTTILSGQSGRLFLDLRDKQSLAYSVSSSSLEGLDPGHVMVHMGTSPDKVPQALAGVYRHLDVLRTTPVSEEELTRAKRYLVGSHAIELQRCGARAMVMALNERFGMGYDEYTRYPQHIKAVTVEDVQRVAQTYLAQERLVEVIVGPIT